MRGKGAAASRRFGQAIDLRSVARLVENSGNFDLKQARTALRRALQEANQAFPKGKIGSYPKGGSSAKTGR